MNALDLINTLRIQYLDDVKVPYLWEDWELADYINQTQDWMCEEALVIRDSTTVNDSETVPAALCVYSLNGTVTPVSTISINPKVIAITRARLTTSKLNLDLEQTIANKDLEMSNWEDEVGVSKELIFKDYDNLKARLYPKLNIADTLTLTVFRYPITYVDLRTTTAVTGLEVPVKYQRRMYNKILSLAYQKQDAETDNAEKATFHYQQAELDLNWIKREQIRYNSRDLVAYPLIGNL